MKVKGFYETLRVDMKMSMHLKAITSPLSSLIYFLSHWTLHPLLNIGWIWVLSLVTPVPSFRAGTNEGQGGVLRPAVVASVY